MRSGARGRLSSIYFTDMRKMNSRCSEPITSRNESGDNEHALLCEVCKGLGDCNPHSEMIGRRHKGTYLHHRNLIVLKHSAQTGCQMCQIFCDCLEDSVGFDTVLAEAEKVELRRAILLSPGQGFDCKRDTDEAAEISRSLAQQQKSQQHERSTKLNPRFAKLARVAKALCMRGAYDEVKAQRNFQGRLVISLGIGGLKDTPGFQNIEVRVSDSRLPDMWSGEGIRKTLEVLISTSSCHLPIP